MSIKNRGFASLDKTRRSLIAGQGGRRAHALGTAHEWTPKEARAAAAKGVAARRAKRDAETSGV
jgi:uncharacterized protein